MAKVLTKRAKKQTTVHEPDVPPVLDATPQDEWETLEWRARRYLGMSAQGFLRRWLAGEWADDPDQPGVLECAACVPLAEVYARERGLL